MANSSLQTAGPDFGANTSCKELSSFGNVDADLRGAWVCNDLFGTVCCLACLELVALAPEDNLALAPAVPPAATEDRQGGFSDAKEKDALNSRAGTWCEHWPLIQYKIPRVYFRFFKP